MEAVITKMFEVEKECQNECQEALMAIAAGHELGDELCVCKAVVDYLKTWLTSKRKREGAFYNLLAEVVAQYPEDFGGPEFLAETQQRAKMSEEQLHVAAW